MSTNPTGNPSGTKSHKGAMVLAALVVLLFVTGIGGAVIGFVFGALAFVIKWAVIAAIAAVVLTVAGVAGRKVIDNKRRNQVR